MINEEYVIASSVQFDEILFFCFSKSNSIFVSEN